MTETPESPEELNPQPDLGPSVGPEKAPEFEDTSTRPDDDEPVDLAQDPAYEIAESDDNDDEDDPEVHEVA